jgi:hypothetical protein
VDDVAGQPGSVAGIQAKKERVVCWCAWTVLTSARDGMQHVGSSPGFHQWIYLVFLYTMVMSKTRLENFDFRVWIKHPLFQEHALIPVVRKFQKSNTQIFTWFGNLPTPRSYWFVLIKLETIQTTKQGGGENLLYSTQALSLSLTFFSLCFHSSLPLFTL